MNRNNLPLNITERKHSKSSLIVSIVCMFILGFTVYGLNYFLIEKPAKKAEAKKEQVQKEEESYLSNNYSTTVNVVAVGNNTIDSNILYAGMNTYGSWNYDFLYNKVKDTIEAADLSIVSQTSPFTNNHNSVAGYPLYLSPSEDADALANAGFDVIASAAYHADDYGFTGITDTLDLWSSKYPNISVLGIHDTQENAAQTKIVTINEIRIALLNYTYGTYSNSLTAENAYALDTFEKEQITQMVNNARSQSDCIIFIANWGESDNTVPTEYEKQWSTYLMDLGVDVIIGTGPMSVQPYGTLSDETGKQTTVFYSLGNFIGIEENPSRLLGGMARFTIEKTVTDGVSSFSIKNNSVDPLIMHYSYDTGSYASYFLSEYTDELAAQNSVYYSGYSFSISEMQQRFDEIMSSQITPATDFSLLEPQKTEDETTSADTTSADAGSETGNNTYNTDNYYDSTYSNTYDSTYSNTYNNTYDNTNNYDYSYGYGYTN